MTKLKGKTLGGNQGQLDVYSQVLWSDVGISIQHGIMDLDLVGGEFAWRKGDKHFTVSRLDKLMVFDDWDTRFRNIKQSIMSRIGIPNFVLVAKSRALKGKSKEWSKTL
ncbi:hypothetical protein H5410_046776 [Solanum commersonii]|uniref:Uncharacterized protein n=1 Tax=Solanum commersonii TaxID=4109 RepID=A0A9J5XGP3_SOLCO|nr:hypothetical protein H5410_046776 [Solanum commersonii]